MDVGDFNVGSAFPVNDFVWQEFLIVLDGLVGISSTDESLDVVKGSGRVDGGLIFGGLTDESFFISERDNRWGDSVTEFVGDDFDLTVFEDTNT